VQLREGQGTINTFTTINSETAEQAELFVLASQVQRVSVECRLKSFECPE
jgi:hypothetical protein